MNFKKASLKQCEKIAHEVRNQIIETCLKNGGHLGASLGSVEIALALHRQFNSPKDKIIWDVGHQAYAHKILTDRKNKFSTIRLNNGLAPFLKREESKHDIFGAGHSSTSISAALGISYKNKNWTIAVIGDGALTAGLSFEALNNSAHLKKRGPLLIILNDNQLSISENVGAIPDILKKENAENYFKLFQFDYYGILDGHDLKSIEETLKKVKKNKNKISILHLKTQKGKGYSPAENNPIAFHGVAPQTSDKIEPIKKDKIEKKWSDLFVESLLKEAKKNPKILAISAAMTEGTGLVKFFDHYPDRSFDVGIAEAHAVTFAAGLATQGFQPVVAIYSTFLQRAFDSIIHDVALQKLNVFFSIDRAGMVGADGPTHHGVFDIAYTSMIPGFKLFFPQSEEDFYPLFKEALKYKGPKCIRYPRGNALTRGEKLSQSEIKNGYKIIGCSPKKAKAILFSIGPIGQRIQSLINLKSKKIALVQILHYSLRDHTFLNSFSNIQPNTDCYFYEEGNLKGSLSESIASQINGNKIFKTIPNHFTEHGSISFLEKKMEWDIESIQKVLKKYE